MKHLSLMASIIIIISLLFGCASLYPHPNISELFVENQSTQLWAEKNYDLFFHYSPEYSNYEHPGSRLIGRLKTDDTEYLLNIHCDGEGGLHFEITQPEYLVLFSGQYVDSGEDFYEIKVFATKISDILPKGTVLHFDISEIEIEDLYIPDFLGRRIDEADDDSDS